MNSLAFMHREAYAILIMCGCGFAGTVLGTFIGFIIGKVWTQKKEPAAWINARHFMRQVAERDLEIETLKARIKAVRLAVEEI